MDRYSLAAFTLGKVEENTDDMARLEHPEVESGSRFWWMFIAAGVPSMAAA